MVRIISHRGLDNDTPAFFESTREAFEDKLRHGFGIECDVRFTKDNELVVVHDHDLTRFSKGADRRGIAEIDSRELLTMEFGGCHLISFRDVLQMVGEHQEMSAISAVHVKSDMQSDRALAAVLAVVRDADISKFFLFDLKLDAARYLKAALPAIRLGLSVAHPHDIERFNHLTGGTLFTLEEVISQREYVDWVWLDEWDRTNKDGTRKALYTAEVFRRARDAGFSIAVISPELHTSPPEQAMRAGHEDSANRETLEHRLREILALKPDALCTDHPALVRQLMIG